VDIVFVKADMQVLSISLKGIKTESAEHSDLDGRLYRKKNDLIITKQESSAFTLVELRDYIDGAEIGDIYLCGIMLGKCVSNTALDGIRRGYSISVLKEGVTAKKESKSDKYLQELANEGVRILTIEDFKKELEL
jgi:nicotinamidase-related amidase